MRSKNPSFRQRPVSMAITLVLLNMYAAAAAADSKSWSSSDTCLSNWWSNSACWNPAGQPGDGDQVNLQRWGSDTRSRSVWYWNELHPDARLSELYVGGNGANVTLAQNFDHRLISNSEYIGLASSHLHAKGSNDIGTLEVGVDTPADRGGYYRLSGSANLKTSLAEVGFRGTGTFEQLGGTHSSHLLYLGTYAGDTGTYALTAGSLASDYVSIGANGVGMFNQTGGVVQASHSIGLGTNAAESHGTYNLSGDGVIKTQFLSVGWSGSGVFNQSGGSIEIDRVLDLGRGGSGEFTLSSGNLSSGQLWLASYGGIGAFLQQGGAHKVENIFFGAETGAGSYTLRGGALDVVGILRTDDGGSGEMTVDGGKLTVGSGNIGLSRFTFGAAAGSNGGYTMNGGAVTVASRTEIGVDGTGSFTQLSGNHTVAVLYEAIGGGGRGSYTLGGGVLSTGYSHLGVLGTASFEQTGGKHLVSNALTLGYAAGGRGTYTLGGSGLLSTNDTNVGLLGQGSFLQRSGTHTAAYLYLGKESTGVGEYRLEDGTLTVSGEAVVGNSGSGAFVQSGGSHQADRLTLGMSAGSRGTYALGGGELRTGTAVIGEGGTGGLSQTGGRHQTGRLVLGSSYMEGGSGSYEMIGGVLEVTATGDTRVGERGSGQFRQYGGVHETPSLIMGGSGAASNGSYALFGGSLTTKSMTVGLVGTGTFLHAGGVLTVRDSGWGTLSVGGGSAPALNGTGRFELSGSGSVAADRLLVGNFGAGAFAQSGGSMDAGVLMVGAFGTGAYSLAGGTLRTGSSYVGLYGHGSFLQSAGDHIVSGSLTVGYPGGGGGSYALTGGFLRAEEIYVHAEAGGEFGFSGGTLSTDTFIGTLENRGGIVAPGESPGTMHVWGDYVQSAAGAVDIEIGGTRAAEQDLLDVSWTAHLAGTLEVRLVDLGHGLFRPRLGDSFDVLHAESIEGAFDRLSLASPGRNLTWRVDYLADFDGYRDAVRLTVVAVPEPETYLMMTGGLGLVALLARRRRAAGATDRCGPSPRGWTD